MTQTSVLSDSAPAAVRDPFLGRLGRWCFRRRWTVLALWLVAVVAGGFAAGPVFAGLDDNQGPSSLEAVAGSDVIEQASTSSGSIVGVVRGINPDSPAVRTAVSDAAAQLSTVSGIGAVVTPYVGSPAAAALRATDGRGLLVQARLAELSGDDLDTATDAAVERLRALGPALRAAGEPGATVEVGGGRLVNREANAQAQKDLSFAEQLSLPITLLVLIFVFGGLLAAFVPVLGAIVSIAGSFTVLLFFANITTLDQNAVTVVTLMGLGLSVDYGLLLVARYRDELAAGREPLDAIGAAWATAGRTIFFSALTVAAALAGMLVFGVTALSALGAAGVSIALVAMLVALTFSAALIGLFRKRIRPSKRQLAAGSADRGFFFRLARGVQRRPLVTALATALVLIAAGFPLLTMKVKVDDLDGLPRSLESVRVIDILAADFATPAQPAVTVVARTDAAALESWARSLDSPDIAGVRPAEQIAPGVATVDIDAVGDPEGEAALRLVDAARADRPDGVESWVTGIAGFHRDLNDLLLSRLPYAIALTLLAMVLLLWAMTGSLIVPFKAVLMNVVSLGATFGVLSAVFEHGVLSEVLRTHVVGGISPFVLVTVFAFAFGLSMDYEVFLLARIKEHVDHGAPNDLAVRRGLQSSGRIITSAALLMVIVFSCFLTGRIGTVQQIGLGLAVAVAVDATLVRCVLVPATMTLLGRWNWWSPRPLARLHARLGFRH
ncbi:MMPL family transporter [Asanoa iriomotensis]|uniref:Membrane protein n=1 Tax=Asanoa iriomotensis TaxID=234613 RepID=A0ABQ4BUL8_9ACTN|nr:MMPL family transporter [Asanoa iriomotensis]GIF54227.1 putative membrane protein [Asanoa iriomotensis]